MTLDNFIVRPKRRLVEKYQDQSAWERLPREARAELAEHLAGLPSAFDADRGRRPGGQAVRPAGADDPTCGAARRPGLRGLQGAHQGHRRPARRTWQRAHGEGANWRFIAEVQTDEYWQDINAPLLEHLRRRLRDLVKLIEPKARKIVYTDFEDESVRRWTVAWPMPATAPTSPGSC